MLRNPIIQKSLAASHYFLRRFKQDRCSEIAAALVYMSLFALVPLMTVLYAVGSAIPTTVDLEAQIEQFLVANLLPESSQEVAAYLHTFSQQAKNLTGVGVLILTLTAILMLRNVERAFNNIWRNRANRGAVSSFLLYWAVLSLAPVMLGLGLGIQAYLYAAANALAGLDSLGISTFVLSLLPFTLSVLGLTALYMTVPNCAVRFQHALLGGLVAAIAFSLARATFTTVIANSSYTLVYGAFAAVPVFLLWLYIIWSIILVGAILVHSLSDYQSAEQANRPTLLKALDALYLLWRAQRQGTPVSEAALLRDRDVVIGGLDGESWRFIRDQLMDARLIAQNADGNFLLSRDLNTVTIDDLKKLINSELPVEDNPGPALAWQQIAQQLLQQQRSAQQQQLGVTVSELFNQGARP